MSKTLFEKIWDKHVVDTLPDGTIQLYIEALPSRANHLYAGPQYPDIEPR